MSLHPHVPEELKSFGKHLFATFLGLLMALGLEAWREHSVEKHRAESHLHSIYEELELNRKECASIAGNQEANLAKCDRITTYLEQLVVDRRAGREPQPLPKDISEIGTDFSFRTAAWDSAKATGIFRLLPQAKLAELSQTVADLERQTRIFENEVQQPWFQDYIYLGFTIFSKPLNQVVVADVEQYMAGTRRFRFFLRKWGRVMAITEKDLTKVMKSQEK